MPAEFQTVIHTLETGIKHVEDEENYPDAQRHKGITLTSALSDLEIRISFLG
jgi:hypothetical protein